jgi:hypothetical protein
MISTGRSSHCKAKPAASTVRVQPVNKAVQHVVDTLSTGGTARAGAVATISNCRDRAAEVNAGGCSDHHNATVSGDSAYHERPLWCVFSPQGLRHL